MKMKIKKKKYEEELKNQYWNGVQAGIKFALKFQQVADRYGDDIEGLKEEVQAAELLAGRIVNGFRKAFCPMEN